MREQWLGEFGDEYTARNYPTQNDIFKRQRMLMEPLESLEQNADILEVGCNTGQNLVALQRNGFRGRLCGVEPNERARKDCATTFEVFNGEARDLPFADGSFDLVFTAGVLIHVPPDEIRDAMREIIRVSNRYVLAIEYFSATERMVNYRGRDDMLWTRDYGQMYCSLGLKWLSYSFRWSGDTEMDSVTWWLLEK